MTTRWTVTWYGIAPESWGEDYDLAALPFYGRSFPTKGLAMAFARKIAGTEAGLGVANVVEERTLSGSQIAADDDGDLDFYMEAGRAWATVGKSLEVKG